MTLIKKVDFYFLEESIVIAIYSVVGKVFLLVSSHLQCLTMSRPEPKSRPLRLVTLLMALCLAWTVSAVVLGLVQRVAALLRRPRLQCRGPGMFI